MDGPRRRLQPAAVRSAGDDRIESKVVVRDDHAVPGHAHIELQRRHADLQRPRERRQRVFRREAPRAAMALEIESVGWHDANR